MNKTLLTFLFLIPMFSFGQIPGFLQTKPSSEPDIYYFKFYNGIQMIEIDYLPAHQLMQSYLDYLEGGSLRAMPQRRIGNPPPSNVYLFRNESGQIVKSYGSYDSIKLLPVQESLIKALSHNVDNQIFCHNCTSKYITTPCFPYYKIGSEPGLVGLIDSLGNVVLPQKYHSIVSADSFFISRIGKTNELRDLNLKIQYSSNKYLIQRANNRWPPAEFHKGYANIIRGEKFGLMNSRGKIIVPCIYDEIVEEFNKYGLAKVQKKNKIGFVNTSGKNVIKCKYQNAGNFNDGLLNVLINGKWGYIDTHGKIVIPFIYDEAFPFSEGLAKVAKKENGQYNFVYIDKEGKVVIPLIYVQGFSFSEGLARVGKIENGQFCFGFIDKEGKVVIPLTYKDATDFYDGIAQVLVDGQWIKIDKTGKQVN